MILDETLPEAWIDFGVLPVDDPFIPLIADKLLWAGGVVTSDDAISCCEMLRG